MSESALLLPAEMLFDPIVSRCRGIRVRHHAVAGPRAGSSARAPISRWACMATYVHQGEAGRRPEVYELPGGGLEDRTGGLKKLRTEPRLQSYSERIPRPK